jgi:hypothetical protein
VKGDAFTQFDPVRELFNVNVRFNLIHGPLSDLYLVYNEQRIGGLNGLDGPAPGRSVILKVTQMLAF